MRKKMKFFIKEDEKNMNRRETLQGFCFNKENEQLINDNEYSFPLISSYLVNS